MLVRLADELRVVFAFLPVAALLSARSCSRALHAALDPRRARARRVWQAAQPVHDWEFDGIPTIPGARLWQVAFPGRGSPNVAFSVACRRGWLAKAQWLDATYALTGQWSHDAACEMFVDACAYGHLAVARWLAARCAITAHDVRGQGAPMRRACENGDLAIAQWLAAAFGVTLEDIRSANDWILRYTCKSGHLAVVQWLVAHFAIRPGDVPPAMLSALLRNALNAGRAAVADWIVGHFGDEFVYRFRTYTPQERRFIARFYESPRDLE
jgi:hypothetical protein